MEEKESLKGRLATEFEIKDLDFLRYFLGIEVMRNRTSILVSQRKYTLDLLKETWMLSCKAVDTLMDLSLKLGEITSEVPVDMGIFQ